MGDNAQSVVFTFKTPGSDDGSAVEDKIIVEIDNEKIEEVYGEGKNTFYPGDKIYFRCWIPSGRSITLTPSDGYVSSESVGKVSKDNRFQFTGAEKDKEKSINVPASSVTDVLWYGRSLGNPVLDGDGFSFIFSKTGVAVCDLTYETTTFKRYAIKLTSIPADIAEYPVLIVIDFEDTEEA